MVADFSRTDVLPCVSCVEDVLAASWWLLDSLACALIMAVVACGALRPNVRLGPAQDIVSTWSSITD